MNEAWEFDDVHTLGQAVARARRALARDGHPEFTELFSERTLRRAVETCLAVQEAPGEGGVGVAPVALQKLGQALLRGEWPRGARLSVEYELRDRRLGLTRDGLFVVLTLDDGDQPGFGFALPILSVHVGPPPRRDAPARAAVPRS